MCVVINLFRWSFFASICRLFARWRWLNQTWWHELSIRLLVNQRRHLANRRTSQSYGPCFILLAVTRAPPTYHLIYFPLQKVGFQPCFPSVSLLREWHLIAATLLTLVYFSVSVCLPLFLSLSLPVPVCLPVSVNDYCLNFCPLMLWFSNCLDQVSIFLCGRSSRTKVINAVG